MKPTLLFALLTTVFSVPCATAMSELDALRARCAAQEQQIQRLEGEVRRLKPGTPVSAAASSTTSATPAASTSRSSGGTYVVRSGDSFEKIARRNGCSVATLAKANGLKPTAIIHPGQKLTLPGSAAPSPVAAAKTSAPAAASTSSALSGKTHTIRAGETFASISRKHKTSVAALVAANPKVKPTALRPGQVIQLSAGSSAAPAELASRPAAQPKATAPAAPRTQMSTAQAAPRSLGSSTPVLSTSAPVRETSPPVASAPSVAQSSIPVSAPLPSNEILPAEAPKSAATAPETSALAPAAAAPAPAADSTPAPTSPSNPEKKIRSVTIEGEMTYGEFAAKHGTDTSRLNDLNGLDLTNATVLAKGSELYVPAQP
ncbi:MAG: LysM peptidoglycan-binding domain-containing protein [Akkermansiaceae bacterium]|nr:LysM peptidoglycan-binding domain-containing protein [Akkermansiaceae bacterium]